MENVSELLQSKKQNLYEKISSNSQVAGLLMSLLSNLVVLAHKKGYPIEGINFEMPHEYQGEVKGRILFSSLALPSAQLWGAKSDFQKYTSQFSRNLYKAFDKNPRIGVFFEQIIEILEQHAKRKSIEFKDVTFKKAIITNENVLVIKLGKENLDKWGR